jgi:formylglycine-generating enzyme required for sulfatase activity
MSDIFLCYSRTDIDVALQLANRFEKENWSVFIDQQTRVGLRWHKEIERELHAARAVVVLWSATSRDSDFVLEEAEYGKHKEILFPAFIESVEFSYGFSRIQTADLIDWNNQPQHPGFLQLLDSLRLHLNDFAVELPKSVGLTKTAQSAIKPVLKSGQTFRDKLKIGGEGPLMVIIPAGRFLMGSPSDEPDRSENEGPQHEVRIAKPFALGVTAVTFDDFDLFCQVTNREQPADEGWGRKNRPVIYVSWHDTQDYCIWLSEQTSRSYRLPSEAEWEYACRAGTSTPFHTGTRISTEQANFNGDYTYNGSAKGMDREKTLAVGTFPPNAFGLYDMHGNVWEWCQDKWHDNYQGAPSDGSSWENEGSNELVLRGGSWSGYPHGARASARHSDFFSFFLPVNRNNGIGFRVLCSSPIE